MFEDTKEVIKGRNSKKDRQHHDQKKNTDSTMTK
jgi:hypothetical protein